MLEPFAVLVSIKVFFYRDYRSSLKTWTSNSKVNIHDISELLRMYYILLTLSFKLCSIWITIWLMSLRMIYGFTMEPKIIGYLWNIMKILSKMFLRLMRKFVHKILLMHLSCLPLIKWLRLWLRNCVQVQSSKYLTRAQFRKSTSNLPRVVC